MEVYFSTNTLLKACSNTIDGNKRWGKTVADKVRLRITEFEAALSLEDISKLPPARCHELSNNRAGQLSVVLHGNMRLIFMPKHDPVPTLPSGGLDWSRVTEILILEVIDYHG
jgi:proteic killer suppression protein